ncbi:monocarboxylate transporter 5-like isoform X2 [Tachypleus tridentatus]|uniref:monocarboxylate transporter 5-like isoform X2 n=1 Tax=Tachypleus tridentatus TaxID=6853 RepID=UPI003FD3E904
MSETETRNDISAKSKPNKKNVQPINFLNDGFQLSFRNVPPDGGWGWMVVLGIVVNNIFIMGQVKASGVYLTMLMDEYKAKSSKVSWVTSLQYTLINVLGISCGICYFSGVIMITKYFDKRRTFANGLGLGATALGGILMPLLLEALVFEYGVRGTMLIMGSLMLHGIVGAMLWEPVERHVKKEHIIIAETRFKDNHQTFRGPRHSDPVINSIFQQEISERKDLENQIKVSEKHERIDSVISDSLSPRRFTVNHVDHSLICKDLESNTRRGARDSTMFTSMIDLGGTVRNMSSEKPKRKGLENIFLHYKNLFDLSLFSSLQWYLLTVTFVLTLTGYPGSHIFLPLRARYAGLSSEQASSLISVMSATDTTARVTFSWLADRNFCPRKYWYIGGVVSAGTACIAFIFTDTYLSMLVTSCLTGSASGCYLPLLLTIFGEEFGSKKLATAYSLSALFAGLVVLGTIPFLGYLVDITRSTVLCYSVLGACLLTAGSVVFLSHLLSTKKGNMNIC